MGDTDIEESLQRFNLDNLTQEEAKMAAAEQLKIAHVVNLKEKVQDVDGNEMNLKGVVDRVQAIDDDDEFRARSTVTHSKLDDSDCSTS